MTDDRPDVGRVDGAGRLVSADPRLAALNLRAGGMIGEILAVPPLATLAHLARTLKMPVSRLVVAADGTQDVELMAKAVAEGDAVVLEVGGWKTRAPRRSWLVESTEADIQASAVPQPWTWASDAALRLKQAMFGPDDVSPLRGSDVIGQPLTRLVRLIEDDDGDLPILSALATGLSFRDQRAVRRDRSDAEILLSAIAQFDGQGRFAGFVGDARPVPTSLPGTKAGSDASITGSADFVERLGQALRTPLDRIVTRADTISAQADGPLRRDYADYAGDIGSAARHLLALVDDLADLQAVERPGFRIDGEPVDLADVARRAAGLLGVRAADKSVRIDRPDGDEILSARGDFRRVLQILVNLLSNAVRYTPPGGMVWLRTEQDGDSAVVVVADQGKGIAAEDHARVFEKFERVDSSEPGGSGLGLYISRRLARAMGGDITLDSAPGQGARFVLTLPVA